MHLDFGAFCPNQTTIIHIPQYHKMFVWIILIIYKVTLQPFGYYNLKYIMLVEVQPVAPNLKKNSNMSG